MNLTDSIELPCADKAVFDDKKTAKAAALLAEITHGTKLRVYLCKFCDLWHLSSY